METRELPAWDWNEAGRDELLDFTLTGNENPKNPHPEVSENSTALLTDGEVAMTLKGLILAVLGICLFGSVSPAQGKTMEEGRNFSLTLSVPHLATAVGEVTWEVRALKKLSFAGVIGAGMVSDFNMLEAGLQARYYVLGDFDHGLPIGFEMTWADVEGSSPVYGDVSVLEDTVTGPYNSFGLFAGYKFISDAGFTLDTNIGAAYGFNTSKKAQEIKNEDAMMLLFNLNLGWSF